LDFIEHRRIESIGAFRPIEREPGDAANLLDVDGCVRHAAACLFRERIA
jgi:hypothetical protein